ncbi:MAG: thioredoxin domain-containing protein [Oscillospiraceae bacterium]|nr:thioredoxin domain-containing protein [Oscillospiraceae bacterium]
MSNHLKNSASPYLLQHSENPVDWYPWCAEAFEKARSEDKPIFLSIGYSTCHWCHVMAHESFEDPQTAEILNDKFISIKVDREERPDIDSVYMMVCQAFTGSGGWPMSVFMTWDKKPFFAGTYFPPRSAYNMPGFPELLNTVAELWENDRERLLRSADEVTERLKSVQYNVDTLVENNLREWAAQILLDDFDKENGGFGDAPKFPTPHNLLFLLLYAKQKKITEPINAVEKTLLQMRKGGIFDQIGYGFARYSTDKRFLAPHFEKMLYDNALLITAYSAAYFVTNNVLYLDTAEKTAEYILREMTAPHGGFYSAQDADSDGVEGRFYTFDISEIIEVLGKEKGEKFSEIFDITESGNFEGTNIPNLLKSSDLLSDFGEEIQRLYDYRKTRAGLHVDDKILLSWNSLMIAAMCMLFRVSHNEKYLNAAVNAQRFIEENMCDENTIYTSWRNGIRSDVSFLDDHAFYTAALIELYNSTLNKEYLDKAGIICREAVKRFSDDRNGGFYLSKAENTELFMNPKEVYDGAIPSGNSVMAYDLVRLYQLTDDEGYSELAEKQIAFLSNEAANYPAGHCMFLIAETLFKDPPEHITVVTKSGCVPDELKSRLPFLANVLVMSEGDKYPLVNGNTTYYVCRENHCLPPSNFFG